MGEEEAECIECVETFKYLGRKIGPVRRRLDGSLPKCREGATSLDQARKTSKERGGGPASVINVLFVSGASGITFWGRDLGFVDRDVPEGGGGAHGLIKKSDGAEGQEAEGQDLEKRNISQDNQRSSNPDTGDVN